MVDTCKYRYKSYPKEFKCNEKVFKNGHCIFHVELPKDEESIEFKEINEKKEEEVQKKIKKKDFNFIGAKLIEINFHDSIKRNVDLRDAEISRNADFSNAKINGDAKFRDVKIKRDAKFRDTEIDGNVSFYDAEIGRDADFRDAKISKFAIFNHAEIGGLADFSNAEIGGSVNFSDAEIGIDTSFSNADIKGYTDFSDTEISGDVSFYNVEIGGYASLCDAKIGGNVSFYSAKIDGNADFNNAKIGRNISTRDVKFKKILNFENVECDDQSSVEELCRIAKKIHENRGNKDKADYYFYHEMVAMRKQKYLKFSFNSVLKFFESKFKKLTNDNFFKKFLKKKRIVYMGFLELPLQYCFGYGVHPWRVMGTWITVMLIFTGIYLTQTWDYSQILNVSYSSVVTAITPGFGKYKPDGWYQIAASAEAIIGTFLWATFIATFSRKYMR